MHAWNDRTIIFIAIHIINMAHEYWVFGYWDNCTLTDLMQSVNRQTMGLQVCIDGLKNASYSEVSERNLEILTRLLQRAHHALNRFCDLFLNLRRMFPLPGFGLCSTLQQLNLYAIEVIYLMESFRDVVDYFTEQRHVIVLFLRIIFKLRIRLEDYLVYADYWKLT